MKRDSVLGAVVNPVEAGIIAALGLLPIYMIVLFYRLFMIALDIVKKSS